MSYLQDIPAPPSLVLPDISFSAPQSRRPSVPATPRMRRNAFSQPTSPIAKKPTSPIAKKQQQLPLSPTRALRKHRYHATFGKHKTKQPDASCPVHAYASAAQQIAAMPSTLVGGLKWGHTPRDILAPTRANCPVHVYAEAASTLSKMGTTAFGKHEEPRALAKRDVCPVHSYVAPSTSLKQRPATFARFLTPRVTPTGSGPAVHAYSEPRSTLASTGATAFSTEKQRDESRRALAPVHAYCEAFGGSTLRKTGGAPLGPRPGLVHSTPPSKPRTLKALPKKLVPLEVPSEASAEEEANAKASSSPREVEAELVQVAAAA